MINHTGAFFFGEIRKLEVIIISTTVIYNLGFIHIYIYFTEFFILTIFIFL